MRIGQLAKVCECSTETIRYYEKIGLLPPPLRNPNGYRSYDDQHRKWLQFILRSRALGFTQKEVRRLSNIAQQSKPICAEVHQLMEEHIADVHCKLKELERLEEALLRLKIKCQEGTLNDCPVIDELMT
jgi:DNA-binding transcriptional MerR regulator